MKVNRLTLFISMNIFHKDCREFFSKGTYDGFVVDDRATFKTRPL